MIEIETGIHIERSPSEVFEFLADVSNNPRWQKGMKSCTWTSAPPMRIGSTYDQVATFLGKEIVSSFEVVELDSGSSVRIKTTTSTFPIDVTRRVEPAGGTTEVTVTIRGGPEGIARFFDPLTRRMVMANVRRDYARLKELLEGP